MPYGLHWWGDSKPRPSKKAKGRIQQKRKPRKKR